MRVASRDVYLDVTINIPGCVENVGLSHTWCRDHENVFTAEICFILVLLRPRLARIERHHRLVEPAAAWFSLPGSTSAPSAKFACAAPVPWFCLMRALDVPFNTVVTTSVMVCIRNACFVGPVKALVGTKVALVVGTEEARCPALR